MITLHLEVPDNAELDAHLQERTLEGIFCKWSEMLFFDPSHTQFIQGECP